MGCDTSGPGAQGEGGHVSVVEGESEDISEEGDGDCKLPDTHSQSLSHTQLIPSV